MKFDDQSRRDLLANLTPEQIARLNGEADKVEAEAIVDALRSMLTRGGIIQALAYHLKIAALISQPLWTDTATKTMAADELASMRESVDELWMLAFSSIHGEGSSK